ncbi:MAG: hypothetical protein NTZ61_04785 [Proteobacteria bacterium]|nr:hypothetical protein [Pseudomonadota bacterium]
MTPGGDLPLDVIEPFARLDRRGFLRFAGALAATGILPAGCGGVPAQLNPPAGVDLQVLSPRSYATFQAVAMRCVGPRGAEVIRAGRIDPARAADLWVARLPALAGPLVQALWVLEWGVAPLVAKWRPFTALDGASQDRVLEDLMRSRLDLKRDLFKGLKSLSMLTFYSDPASRALDGHPGAFDAAGIVAAMKYEPDV